MFNLKIRRRVFGKPMGNSPIWIIPTFTYILLKNVGDIVPNREWVWWVLIPSLFIFWFFINFKIVRGNGINR